jgi:integrase
MAERIRVQKGIHLYRRDDAEGWWTDLHKNGQRTKRALEARTRKEAEAEARRLFAALGESRVTTSTLEDALALWLQARPRTDNERSAIRVFLDLYGNRALHAVDHASIFAVMGHKSPGTYNRTLNILRAALNMAVDVGMIDRAPKLLKKPGETKRDRFLSADEYQRLRAALPAHLVAPFDFALATGQRKANVLGLKWQHIHGDLLVIPASSFKQRRGHSVPLGKVAKDILAGERGKHPEYVFTYRGRPFKDAKTAYNKAKHQAGLTDLTWHDLRHSFASWLLMSGAPLVAVKEAGGWSDMESVARYAHLERKQLAQYADNAIGMMQNRHKTGTDG